jgi:hypothetical protein
MKLVERVELASRRVRWTKEKAGFQKMDENGTHSTP